MVTLDTNFPENVYKGRFQMVQQESYNRTFRPNSSNPSQRISIGQGVKTYYPQQYYQKCNYQKSEVSTKSAVRRDALGQRVRERFNEDLDGKTSVMSSERNHKALKSVNLPKETKSVTQSQATYSWVRRALAPQTKSQTRTIKSNQTAK